MPPVEVQGLICSPARKGVEGKPSFVETSSKGLGQDTYFLCKKAFPWLLFTYTFYLRYGFAPLGFIGLSSFVGLPPPLQFLQQQAQDQSATCWSPSDMAPSSWGS